MKTDQASQPFLVNIVLAAFVALFCTQAHLNAAENKWAGVTFEQLIADVLPIHQKAREISSIDAVPDEAPAILASRPQEAYTWQALQIGEFESDAAFRQRQEQVKQREVAAFQAATEAWKREIAAATERREARALQRAKIARRDVTPRLVALGSEKPIGAIVPIWETPTLALPYFDRTQMVFEHVQFPGISTEVSSRGGSDVLGCFASSTVDLRIRVSDLETAQTFKTAASAGKVRFLILVEPWLTQIESPIITKPAHDEQEIDKGAVATSALEYLLVAAGSAMGADADSVNAAGGQAGYDVAHRNHHKIVHYDAETRDGVRFHFDLDTVLVRAVDENGKPLPGVEIEFLNRPNAAIRFTGLQNDAQAGAKVLILDALRIAKRSAPKEGDEILNVAGKKVKNADDCIATIKAQPAGATFKVAYRSAEDGHEHDFLATGGYLGANLVDVYPDNQIRIGNVPAAQPLEPPYWQGPRVRE